MRIIIRMPIPSVCGWHAPNPLPGAMVTCQHSSLVGEHAEKKSCILLSLHKHTTRLHWFRTKKNGKTMICLQWIRGTIPRRLVWSQRMGDRLCTKWSTIRRVDEQPSRRILQLGFLKYRYDVEFEFDGRGTETWFSRWIGLSPSTIEFDVTTNEQTIEVWCVSFLIGIR